MGLNLVVTIKLSLFCCSLQKQSVGLNCFDFLQIIALQVNLVDILVNGNRNMSKLKG